MEDGLLTRSYLDSLCTDELARLADSLGLDIPPGLDRPFIIEELLETAEEGGEDDEDGPLETSLIQDDFAEPVMLPKQYNITYIRVMVRDPLWAFVFWEVKSSDKDVFEKSIDFESYCLKVSPCDKQGPAVRAGVFFVPVGVNDCARYLGFPTEDAASSGAGGRKKWYKVELCVQRGGEEQSLAASRPFMLPELPGRGIACGEAGAGQAIRLSGGNDFPILRNGDRLPRNKHSAEYRR